MGWLNAIVRKTAKKTVDDFVQSDKFNSMLDDTIRDVLNEPKYAFFRFVKHMQARLHEVDPSMAPKEAFECARKAYLQFLHDEKVQFGDPRYDWTRDGARDLIQSYEIDYWEST